MGYNLRKRKPVTTKPKSKKMSTGKKVALKAAGATLGFIAGDIPGAKLGYAAANKYIAYDNKRKKELAKRQVVSISRDNDLTIHRLPPYKFSGKGKKFSRGLGNYTYKNMSQRVISNQQGTQAYGMVEPILHWFHLNGNTSDVRNDLVRFTDNLFDLNPFSNTLGTNPIHTVTPAKNVDGDKLHIKSVSSNVGIMNLTKLPVEVCLYYITPNSHTNLNPDEAWVQGIENTTYGQTPKNARNNISSLTFPNINTAAGKSERNTWGSNPFAYVEFRKAYRCLRSHKFILQPGDQRHIETSFEYNRTFLRNELYTQTGEFMRNTTVIPYVIARAGMVGMSSTDGGDTGEVSYGAPKIGIIHNQTLKMKAMPFTKQSVNRVLNCLVENDTTDFQKIVDTGDNEKQDQGAAAWHI